MADVDSNVSIGLEIEPVGGNVFNALEVQAEKFYEKLMGYQNKPIEVPLRLKLDQGTAKQALSDLKNLAQSFELGIPTKSIPLRASVGQAVTALRDEVAKNKYTVNIAAVANVNTAKSNVIATVSAESIASIDPAINLLQAEADKKQGIKIKVVGDATSAESIASINTAISLLQEEADKKRRVVVEVEGRPKYTSQQQEQKPIYISATKDNGQDIIYRIKLRKEEIDLTEKEYEALKKINDQLKFKHVPISKIPGEGTPIAKLNQSELKKLGIDKDTLKMLGRKGAIEVEHPLAGVFTKYTAFVPKEVSGQIGSVEKIMQQQQQQQQQQLEIKAKATPDLTSIDSAVGAMQKYITQENKSLNIPIIATPTQPQYTPQPQPQSGRGYGPQSFTPPDFISQPEFNSTYSGPRGVGSKRLVDQYGREMERQNLPGMEDRIKEIKEEIARGEATLKLPDFKTALSERAAGIEFSKPAIKGPLLSVLEELKKRKAELAELVGTYRRDLFGNEFDTFTATPPLNQPMDPYSRTIVKSRKFNEETDEYEEMKETSRIREESAIVSTNEKLLEVKNKIISAGEEEIKIIRTEVDLIKQLTVAEQKRLLKKSISEPSNIQEALARQNRASHLSQIVSGPEWKSKLIDEKSKTFGDKSITLQTTEYTRAVDATTNEVIRISEATGEYTRKLVENKEAVRQLAEEERRLEAERKKRDKYIQESKMRTPEKYEFEPENEEAREKVNDIVLKDEMKQSEFELREFTKEMKKEEAQAERTAEKTKKLNIERGRIAEFQKHYKTKALSEGFRESAPSRLINARTGDVGQIQQYYKVHHDGLAKWSVTLREFNTLTGIATQRVIHGAAAAKFLGDSLFRAGEKVLIWTASTTVLFTFLGLVRSLGRQIKELESNEVLLSRVSDRLVYSVNNAAAALSIKQKIAREITHDITLYAAAIGGSAIEAQKAAVSYLRAGQSQEDVMVSVKAALIATHIAEIDVAQAAEFLTSAYLQFNLTAKDLLPTLDSLNTLSNNYKVTTKDLLDSISRTGEVYAEHNGSLEELAATTAVVSQVTSRTGTQIGNAIKTIQSNLDRPETKKMLFEELGIQTHDAAGEAKSFAKMLLELRTRMLGVSDAEQKQIQLGVSNIRQRSILATAINNIADIHVAENKALNESGSAMREYEENSKTLSVALQRLQGDFSVLANNTRGPIGDLVKEITAGLSGLLKLLNSFDGAGANIVARGAIFAGLVIGIQKLVTKLFPAASGLAAMSLGFNTVTTTAAPAAASINSYNMYCANTPIVNNAAASSMWTLAGSMSAVKNFAIGLFNPLTIIIGVLTVLGTVLLDNLAASNAYSHELENQISLNDQLIASEQKKQKALKSSTESILAITDEMIRQAAVGQAGGDSKKALENYKTMLADLNKIAASAKLPLMDTSIPDINEIDKKMKEYRDRLLIGYSEADRQSRVKERDTTKKNISITTLDIQRKKEEIVEPEKKLETGIEMHRLRMRIELNRIRNETERQRDLNYREALKDIGINMLNKDNIEEYIIRLRELRDRAIKKSETWNVYGSDREEDIAEMLQLEIKYLEERITKYKETSGELDNLKTKLDDYNQKLLEQPEPPDAESQGKINAILLKLRDNARNVNTEMEGIKKKFEVMNSLGLQIPYEDYDKAVQVLNKRLEESTAELNKWREVEPFVSKDYIGPLEEINKKIKENRDEMTKMRDKARFPELLKTFNEEAKIANSLLEKMVINAGRIKNSNLRITGGPAEINILDDRINYVKQQIDQAKRDYDILSAEIAYKDLAQEDSDHIADLAKSENLRTVIQDRLNDLKNLELERMEKIQAVETEITLEKKKQTEEALKSLGTMDEESKLRLYAMAQYLRKNPDYKITLDDLFMADEKSASLMTRFFGKYIESNPMKSKIGANMAGVEWFGVSQETYAQAQEIEKYKTLTDTLGKITDFIKGLSDIDKQARITAGSMSEKEKSLRSAFEPTQELKYDIDKVTNTYNITVGPNAVDIKSLNLGESLKKGVEAGVNRAIMELEKHNYIMKPTNAIEVPALQSKATGGKLPGEGPIPILAHGGELIIPKKKVDQGLAGVVDFAKRNGLVFEDGGIVPRALGITQEEYDLVKVAGKEWRRLAGVAGVNLSTEGFNYYDHLKKGVFPRSDPIEKSQGIMRKAYENLLKNSGADRNTLLSTSYTIDDILKYEFMYPMPFLGDYTNPDMVAKAAKYYEGLMKNGIPMLDGSTVPATNEEKAQFKKGIDNIRKIEMALRGQFNSEYESIGSQISSSMSGTMDSILFNDIAKSNKVAIPNISSNIDTSRLSEHQGIKDINSGYADLSKLTPEQLRTVRRLAAIPKYKEMLELKFGGKIRTIDEIYPDTNDKQKRLMEAYYGKGKAPGYAEGGKLNGDGAIPIIAHGGELIIPKKNVDQGITGILDFVEKFGLKFRDGGIVPNANSNNQVNTPMSGGTTINNVYNLTVLPGAFNLDPVVGEFNRVMESVVKAEVNKLRQEIDRSQATPMKTPRFRKGIENA